MGFILFSWIAQNEHTMGISSLCIFCVYNYWKRFFRSMLFLMFSWIFVYENPKGVEKVCFLSSFNKVLLSADVINLVSLIINAVMSDAGILLQSSTYIDLNVHR
jgi:hypothetical protein